MSEFNLPKYYMEAYDYAHEYIKKYNSEAEKLNNILIKYGYAHKLQYRTLNVVFWMNCDLRKEKAWGQYIAEGIQLDKSPCGLIKIDIIRIGNFEQIKETIRHEIAHAIAHQINGCAHNGHNHVWQEIAVNHNVNIDRYKK